VKVIDPAQGSDEFTVPEQGKRFVAVVFAVRNVGSSPDQGDANNNTTVIGSDNQSYSADFDNVNGCTNFSEGSYQLGPGESANGCVVVQLPKAVNAAKVQWNPQSGFSDSFAEWLVP
jgi:hypothetical protein